MADADGRCAYVRDGILSQNPNRMPAPKTIKTTSATSKYESTDVE